MRPTASTDDLLDTVARLQSRFSLTRTTDVDELFLAYEVLTARFEKDLGASIREVALAKASALMLIQEVVRAKEAR